MKKVFYLVAILILLFSSNSFAATDAPALPKERLEVYKTVLQTICIAKDVLLVKNSLNLSMENKNHFSLSKGTPFNESYLNDLKNTSSENYENELLGNFSFTESGPIDLDIRTLAKLNRRSNTPIFSSEKNKYYKNWVKEYVEDNLVLTSNFLSSKNQALIVSKVKEFIPDFNLNAELHRKEPRLYSQIKGNETSYFLKDTGTDIRLITFVKEESDIIFKENTVSISLTEHYY
jgi:hypothetical protein